MLRARIPTAPQFIMFAVLSWAVMCLLVGAVFLAAFICPWLMHITTDLRHHHYRFNLNPRQWTAAAWRLIAWLIILFILLDATWRETVKQD